MTDEFCFVYSQERAEELYERQGGLDEGARMDLGELRSAIEESKESWTGD